MNQSPSISLFNSFGCGDPLLNAKRRSGAVSLTDVTPVGDTWLWPGRISFGNVTLVVSDPGLGKSLLTLDIAARVTTGRPWPDVSVKSEVTRVESHRPASGSCLSTLDSRPPASVLIINIEDHFANTIKPRLEAAGADCSRVLALTYVPGDDFTEPTHLFALNRDIHRLAPLFEAVPDIRLVIIDPFTAFLGGASDQSNANIWNVLSALASLARRRNLAVLAVTHFRKKEGPAIHRTLGSLAFIAAARNVWTIAKDPADANIRLLLPIKNNLSPSTPGLAFTIESDESCRTPIIRWLPDVIETPADLLLAPYRSSGRPDEERRFATRWLRDQLSPGPTPMRTIRNAAEAHGISYGTLRRAFRQLGAVAFQPNNVLHGPWMWKLPGSGAQNQGGEFCAPANNTDEFTEPFIPSTLPTPHSPLSSPTSDLQPPPSL